MVELLNTIARVWWNWTASMFWQVGLLILVIAAIDLLTRKWAWPQLRYALWSLILVKLLLPPTLSLPSGVVPELRPHAARVVQWVNTDRPEASRKSAAIANSVFNVSSPFGDPTITGAGSVLSVRSVPVRAFEETPDGVTTNEVRAAGAKTPSSAPFVWQFYAMTLWLFGTLILGICLYLRLHSVAGRQRSSGAVASLPQSFYNHLADCSKRLGLHRVPRVVVTKRLTSPAVFGVLSPVLLVPKGYLSKLSRRDTEHMLLHELAHIKRGDLVMHSLYLLLQVVYWYNPLLWLVRRHMHHLRELSCDGTVAELLRERTLAYRQTLLETARRMLTTSVEPGLGLLGLFEDSNYLLVRLHWLTKPTWRYCTMKRAIVATIALLMFACVLPMAQGRESAPNDVTKVSSNEVVPVRMEEENQQAQDQVSRDITKLQARLEQLMAQQQELQNQLKALAEQRNQLRGERRESGRGPGGGAPGVGGRESRERAEGRTRPAAREPMAGRGGGAPGGQTEMPPQAREQFQRAHEQVLRAQEEAKRAMKEAARAQKEAEKAHAEARHLQSQGQKDSDWEQSMEAYGAQMEQWEQSEPMRNWEADMEKWGEKMERWGQEFGQRQAAAVSGSAGNSEAREMPPMPAMPPMPPMPAMPAMPPVPPVPVAVPEVPMPAVEPPSPGTILDRQDGRQEAVNRLEQAVDLTPGQLLEVANSLGTINVRGGDGPGCKIVATVKARAETMEEAKEIAGQIKLTVTPSDGKVRIAPTKPANENRRNGPNYQVILDVTVPRKALLRVSQSVGNIHLASLRGSIEATTQVGSIQATDVAGRVILSADVGSIGFFAPQDFSAKVQAKAKMGSVQSDFPLEVVKPRGIAMGSTASGTIGGGEGELSLQTNVGSIGIRAQGAEPKQVERRQRVERMERSRSAARPRPEPRPNPEPLEEF